jgi:hypothetical protein
MFFFFLGYDLIFTISFTSKISSFFFFMLGGIISLLSLLNKFLFNFIQLTFYLCLLNKIFILRDNVIRYN